jgi:hypothetical protein
MRRINDAEEWEAEQIPNENPTLLPLSSSEKQRHRPFIQKLLGRAGAMVAELVIGSGAWWGTCTKPHPPIHQATSTQARAQASQECCGQSYDLIVVCSYRLYCIPWSIIHIYKVCCGSSSASWSMEAAADEGF